jgi:hypothetical protein
MDGMIAHLNAQSGGDPLLDLAIGSKAVRLGEALLKLGELVRGQGGGFASRDVEMGEGSKTAVARGSQPAADGVAVEAEEGSELGAIGRLAAGEEVEGMEALAFAMVMLVLEQLLESIGWLVDDGERLVHGLCLSYLRMIDGVPA